MAIWHFRLLISSFYNNYFIKLITNFEIIDTILLIKRLTIKLIVKLIVFKQKQSQPVAKIFIKPLKQKQSQLVNCINKPTKKK